MSRNISITGLGVVTPYGIGTEEFANGCKNSSGYPMSDLGSVSSEWGAGKLGAVIPGYDLKQYLGRKGLRTLDRITLNLSTAIELIHADLGFDELENRRKWYADEEVSIVLGTTGPIQSIADFDQETVMNPKFVQPGLFPNTVFNAPASYAAIRKSIKASCVTVTNGDPSSLDAIRIGANQLDSERARLAFVAGATEMTPWHIAMCAAAGVDNFPLSEGAMVLSLETADDAGRRGAPVLGTVAAMTSLFSPEPTPAVKEAMRRLKAEAAADYQSITDIYTNREDLLSEITELGGCKVHNLTNRFGYMGPLFGITALTAALLEETVLPGDQFMILDVGREGNLAAGIFSKSQEMTCM
jgi:3-oxoacyl-[acyl-carrier-protein] synthase II